MFFQYYKVLTICILCWLSSLWASQDLIDPIAIVTNPCPAYSLINSVDFHPKENLFCVTCTHGNKVVFYKIDDAGNVEMVQSINNPVAQLSEPQHAVFSPDGKKIVVANWTNQTLTIYQCDKNGLFSDKPVAIIPPPLLLINHKPHGIVFSPHGNFLAIAYGASSHHERAIAMYRINMPGTRYELVSVLPNKALPGIPKGITFSPDGTCLLVTFSDVNSIAIFGIEKKNQDILQIPLQVIQGEGTRISRPEDVKISADGSYCAISNSDQHNITFYPFDKTRNYITQSTPSYVLQNPAIQFCFPHGIAFSPDGSFMVITEFGPIETTHEGGIYWDSNMPPESSRIKVYTTEAIQGCFGQALSTFHPIVRVADSYHNNECYSTFKHVPFLGLRINLR